MKRYFGRSKVLSLTSWETLSLTETLGSCNIGRSLFDEQSKPRDFSLFMSTTISELKWFKTLLVDLQIPHP
ncbi:hypothetical protein CR513_32261, partial [Mucuna pruriens]